MAEMQLNRRQRRLWDLHDFSVGRGLEIGPLHNTSVRREHADVAYLDVFDRDGLIRNYARNPGINPDKIPEIDFVLHDGERVRSLPEAVGDAAPFQWVMAAHVIEHVPDVIGWLAQVAEVVDDGGALVLVVPDRRYCFDIHRPGTTTGQLIQAHEAGDVVPSVRAVFDYKRGHAFLRDKAKQAWALDAPTYDQRVFPLDEVLRLVEKARQGEYIDSHVWTFTPGTLIEQLVELRGLGLSEWRVETWTPTRRNESEFFAVLRRLPRAGWTDADLADEPVPEGGMPDWLADDLDVRRRLASSRTKLRERRDKLERQSKQLKRLRRELAATRAELDAVRSSTRWRVGGAATVPVRALKRLRRR